MEKDPILKRAEAILQDIPDSPMSPASRQLLHENPLDWVVSRKRSLRAAMLNGDEETLNMVTDDIAHVVGKRNAEWLKLTIMGDLVAQNLDNPVEQ